MKIRSKLFLKSFLLSLVIFVLLAGIIITSLYIDKTALVPTERESTLLLGLIDGDSVVSLMLICARPQSSTLTLLPIPDYTLVNGKILQEQYTRGNADTILESLSGIVGRNIDRYMLISADALEASVNTIGAFTHFIQYQFDHSGKTYGGTYTQMNGELVRSMLTYDGYNKKTVSVSELCAGFFETFMTKHISESRLGRIQTILTDSIASGSTDTDLTESELAQYCELFSKYQTLTHTRLALSGKIDGVSAERNYFIPDTLSSEHDIFE